MAISKMRGRDGCGHAPIGNKAPLITMSACRQQGSIRGIEKDELLEPRERRSLTILSARVTQPSDVCCPGPWPALGPPIGSPKGTAYFQRPPIAWFPPDDRVSAIGWSAADRCSPYMSVHSANMFGGRCTTTVTGSSQTLRDCRDINCKNTGQK